MDDELGIYTEFRPVLGLSWVVEVRYNAASRRSNALDREWKPCVLSRVLLRSPGTQIRHKEAKILDLV